jgi:hypothetical protein
MTTVPALPVRSTTNAAIVCAAIVGAFATVATAAIAASNTPQAATPAAPEVQRERAPAVVGLPVISADGQTVGQVLSVGPGAHSKWATLHVKAVDGLAQAGKSLEIPADRAIPADHAVQLIVSFEDVKKFYAR